MTRRHVLKGRSPQNKEPRLLWLHYELSYSIPGSQYIGKKANSLYRIIKLWRQRPHAYVRVWVKTQKYPPPPQFHWTTMTNWNTATYAPQNYVIVDARVVVILSSRNDTEIQNVLKTVSRRSILFKCLWHATISWVQMPSCTHLAIPPYATKYIHLSQLTKSKYSLPFRPTTRFDELLPVAVDISEYSITGLPQLAAETETCDVQENRTTTTIARETRRNEYKCEM